MEVVLPVLETERLILKKFENKDADDLFEFASDEETVRYVSFNKYLKIEDAHDRIDYLKAKYAEHNSGCYGIVLKSDRKLIGSVELDPFKQINNRAELGYILNKKYWNNGYITEAVGKAIEYGFDKLKLSEIFAKCLVENIASARVMEKNGMIFDKIVKEEFKNRIVDCKYYIKKNDRNS